MTLSPADSVVNAVVIKCSCQNAPNVAKGLKNPHLVSLRLHPAPRERDAWI